MVLDIGIQNTMNHTPSPATWVDAGVLPVRSSTVTALTPKRAEATALHSTGPLVPAQNTWTGNLVPDQTSWRLVMDLYGSCQCGTAAQGGFGSQTMDGAQWTSPQRCNPDSIHLLCDLTDSGE